MSKNFEIIKEAIKQGEFVRRTDAIEWYIMKKYTDKKYYLTQYMITDINEAAELDHLFFAHPTNRIGDSTSLSINNGSPNSKAKLGNQPDLEQETNKIIELLKNKQIKWGEPYHIGEYIIGIPSFSPNYSMEDNLNYIEKHIMVQLMFRTTRSAVLLS